MEKKKAAKRIVSAKKSVADELNAKLKDALSTIKHKDEVIQVNCDIVFHFPFQQYTLIVFHYMNSVFVVLICIMNLLPLNLFSSRGNSSISMNKISLMKS